jgi:dipeptidyl aminopeptidase/acylaminoacyl peptidase
VRTVVKEGHIAAPNLAGDRLLFLLDHLKSPAELHSVTADGKDMKAITKVNAERLAGVTLGDFEQFSFKGWNDETVYGFVVKPADFTAGKKYPIAFLIHGGPQGSFSNNFHYRWNPQTYAAAGYAAVMIDFHGSTGYGQAFTDAIRHDWGGKPLVDLQKGLEAAVARYPFLDGARACALGASYGGFMINWIAGNWPDRFKCLVNHDGNLDERFAYYATEELWFPEWEHGGTPWDNPEGYAKHNPIDHVAKWKTPMLVVHGARDYRVVYSEGLATFTALQRRGIPSRFLYFPDENHWVLKPANSILWHDTVLGWLDQWTKDAK